MKKISLSVLAMLFCSMASAQKLTSFVDPTIGTGDHGHVFIGANVPFGMVQAGPTQMQSDWDWCSGYHVSSDNIIGFSQLHLSGTGCSDLGDVALMPIGGDVKCSRSGLASTFKHENETARAGYYKVKLDRWNIDAEMTATERTALYRFTYASQSDKNALVVDLENGVGEWDRMEQCRFTQLDEHTIVGFRHSHGWANRQKLFYAISFKDAIESIEYRDGARPNAQKKAYAIVKFKGNPTSLLAKVALSPTSEVNAMLNMRTEIPGWDFAAVQKAADESWEKELSRVKATFPTERESRMFYTSMFHFMVAPQLWNDCNGDYMAVNLRPVQGADYNHLTTFSLWDTYRAAHPLATIIAPDRSRDYAKTMMDIFDNSGELPVWHLMSNETYCMVGEPAVPVLADIILKGQNADVDAEKAYQAMKASVLPADKSSVMPQGFNVISRTYDFRGKNYLSTLGYIPYDSEQGESVAKNMEYYLAIWSAAQVAGKLGHKEDSVKLATLSKNYTKLYDRRVGYMRALSSKGEFRSIEGFKPGHQTGDYTEGNPWHYTFLVPHDVNGLVELLGGPKAFEKKLDALFTADSDLGENANPDITGLIGQYAHGNEPSHHVLYLYNYIGKPHKTQKMIRRVMDELYDDKPAGLCGNEDVGQMSAWYILSALGFYQVEPCGGIYQLGCPAVKEASIPLPEGKTFLVRTKGNPHKGIVKRWTLNGKPLKRTFITHGEIMSGGILEATY